MLSKKFIAIIITLLISEFAVAQIKEIKPAGPYCHKASGLSQGFAEFVASKLKVSVKSVTLIRASQDPYGYCEITVDTAKGPQSCVGATIFTDGKSFWIGGNCF